MTSDTNANQQDIVPGEGQSSAGQQKSSTQPEVFTKDKVEQLIRERHSTLDKRIAELEKTTQVANKALEAERQRAKTAADRAAQLEEEKSRRELEGIKDNPDALSLWQARQTHRDEVRQLEAEKEALAQQKAQYATDLEEAKTYKVFKNAHTIASKPEYAGVKAETLVELTDGTPDKMEGLAKLLKAAMGQPAATKTETSPPDSGRSTGGAGEPSAEELDAMPMAQYAEWYNKRHKKR